jgi:hypothetical protein
VGVFAPEEGHKVLSWPGVVLSPVGSMSKGSMGGELCSRSMGGFNDAWDMISSPEDMFDTWKSLGEP